MRSNRVLVRHQAPLGPRVPQHVSALEAAPDCRGRLLLLGPSSGRAASAMPAQPIAARMTPSSCQSGKQEREAPAERAGRWEGGRWQARKAERVRESTCTRGRCRPCSCACATPQTYFHRCHCSRPTLRAEDLVHIRGHKKRDMKTSKSTQVRGIAAQIFRI